MGENFDLNQGISGGKYSILKIFHYPEKLNSFSEGKVTAPISVRIKPTNRCDHHCFYCLKKGTMVLTPNGSIPIEKLKKGDVVISGDRKKRKVTEIFKRISKMIYKIDVEYLPDIYASPEHPFLVDGKFIDTKDLKKGMKLKVVQPLLNLDKYGGRPKEILYLSKMFNNKEKRYHSKRRNGPYDEVGRFRLKGSKYSAPQKMSLDYDFGRFCGLYLAEGNIHISKNRPNSKAIIFSFNKKEKKYINFITSFCNKYKFKYRINEYDYLTTTQVMVNNSIFSFFIEKYFGFKGKYKRVPFELNMNNSFVKGLIRGYFDGDGCISDYSLFSSNKTLIYGILQLLLNKGIIPTVYRRKSGKYNIEGRTGNAQGGYYLRISRKQINKFKHILKEGTKPLFWERIKPFYVKINKTELIKESTEVFNIEVEEDHTYFAEFLLCHNCVYDPKFSGTDFVIKPTDEIPTEKMIEVLNDFDEMGVKAITLTGGGEPLYHPGISKILNKTLEKKIGLSIITHGQHLKGKPAELLWNADWVRVSLDYHNSKLFSKIRQKPGKNFYKIRNNILEFSKNKNPNCDLGVNCVVHNLNYSYLEEIAKSCKEMGVDNLRFAPVWKKDFLKYHKPFKNRAIEQIEKAKKLQDESISIGDSYGRYFGKNTGGDERGYPRCFYMEMVPVIAADQRVYVCHNKAYSPRGIVGSIETQSFKDMWFSPETTEFFRQFNPQKVCKHECSNDEKNRVLTEFLKCQEKGVVEYI